MGLTLVAAVILLCGFWAYGRLRETSLWADWKTLLTRRGRNAYMEGADRLGEEQTLVRLVFGSVRVSLDAGELSDAVTILGAAYTVLADTAPSLGSLLSGLSRLSRMLSAIAPMDPGPAAVFRDPRLRRFGSWTAWFSAPLVSSGERFRLRVYLLALECRALTRYLLESKQRLEAAPRADSPSWEEIEALVADYHTLSDEVLASLRALVASAERR